jgi:hypothetical protein
MISRCNEYKVRKTSRAGYRWGSAAHPLSPGPDCWRVRILCVVEVLRRRKPEASSFGSDALSGPGEGIDLGGELEPIVVTSGILYPMQDKSSLGFINGFAVIIPVAVHPYGTSIDQF